MSDFGTMQTRIANELDRVGCPLPPQLAIQDAIKSAIAFYQDEAAAKPEPEPFLNWKRIEGSDPVVTRLSDLPWYTTPSWTALLPGDTFVGV